MPSTTFGIRHLASPDITSRDITLEDIKSDMINPKSPETGCVAQTIPSLVS